MSIDELKRTVPLIAPKHFSEFQSPEEYHAYVQSMYELRTKGRKSVASAPVPGISISRTQKGALSIRRNSKTRPFAYVLQSEIELLAKHAQCSIAEMWNTFKSKKYLIAKTRIEAESIYSDIKQIPFGNLD